MSGHGWRTVASTWGNEGGYNRDAIEIPLRHSADAKNPVRSAYKQPKYLAERRSMLQDFADRLDQHPTAASSGQWYILPCIEADQWQYLDGGRLSM